MEYPVAMGNVDEVATGHSAERSTRGSAALVTFLIWLAPTQAGRVSFQFPLRIALVDHVPTAVADAELVDEHPRSSEVPNLHSFSSAHSRLLFGLLFGWEYAFLFLNGFIIDSLSYHAFLPQRQSSTATKSHEESLLSLTQEREEVTGASTLVSHQS